MASRWIERISMNSGQLRIAVIKGDGIGVDVTNATLAVIAAAERRIGGLSLGYEFLDAGAACFRQTGRDMAPAAEQAAAAAEAIFLGAIGLPSVRHEDGTEIAPLVSPRGARRGVAKDV